MVLSFGSNDKEERGDTCTAEGLGTRASSRGITERAIPWQRDVTYVTQYARCHLCRAICSDASLGAGKPAHSTRLALSKERTSSAPALITARRRSYFTPRSSIIHAVNNAPLFRVTLYPGLSSYLSLPSFLPPPLVQRGVRECPECLGGERSGCALYPFGTLLSPGLSTETETRFGPLARQKPALRPALYSTPSRGRFPRDR